MPISIHYYLNFLVLLTLSVFINCGGTGSEVGNRPLICGQLFDTCGTQARNAEVTIRLNNYLSPLISGYLSKRLDFSDKGYAVTRTDNNGVYEFSIDDIDNEGIYCIEAWDEQKNNCIFINDIDIKITDPQVWYVIDTPFVTTDETLRPPVSLTGTVYPIHESTNTIIRIFGLDTYVHVDNNGTFRLNDLPQGNHTLQIVTLQEKASFDTVSIKIEQKTTMIPDTIIPSAYRVVYYYNANPSGTVPIDDNWYEDGETVTVLACSSGMTRPGFVFTGWSTHADGSGTLFTTGDTLLKINSQISFYAQWTEYKYMATITSQGNGTVTGTDSVAHGIPHSITATPNAGNNFTGWRIKSGNAEITDPAAAVTTTLPLI
jgi:uncharacterized repeat protein (TIGR02543 family)